MRLVDILFLLQLLITKAVLGKELNFCNFICFANLMKLSWLRIIVVLKLTLDVYFPGFVESDWKRFWKGKDMKDKKILI